MQTHNFSFEYNGNVLNGLLDFPETIEPDIIVISVHGHDRTDAVAQNWDLGWRSQLTERGLAHLMWDKAGCGKSTGEYDHGQPVQDSAREILAAIQALANQPSTRGKKIALKGFSRAGWICPLVIDQFPEISFWISVSGPDDKENFQYLLETNLLVEGRSPDQIKLLMKEWRDGYATLRKGLPFSHFLALTPTLRNDPFIQWLNLGGQDFEKTYTTEQQKFVTGKYEVDEESGLMVYIKNFPEILKKIRCPVLAIFGEKDTNVDWRKTKSLYEETMGKNPEADLTILSFPDGNHGILKCKTGGIREFINSPQKPATCDGYEEAILSWLEKKVVKRPT